MLHWASGRLRWESHFLVQWPFYFSLLGNSIRNNSANKWIGSGKVLGFSVLIIWSCTTHESGGHSSFTETHKAKSEPGLILEINVRSPGVNPWKTHSCPSVAVQSQLKNAEHRVWRPVRFWRSPWKDGGLCLSPPTSHLPEGPRALLADLSSLFSWL